MRKIMKFIRSHERLYKIIYPIEMKCYCYFYSTLKFWRLLISYCIIPRIRRLIRRKETRDLLKFHNIHKGERIFIVMPGPSLREEDVLKLQDEITMCVNGAVALVESVGWRSTYYVTGYEPVYLRERDRILNAGYKDVFLNIRSLKKYESEFTFKPHYYNTYRTPRDIWAEVKGKICTKMDFSDDIYLKGVYLGGRSIATTAVQIAVYMGASEIYLLGQDCDYNGKKHYFNDVVSDVAINAPDSIEYGIQSMFAFYRNAREYCEQHNIKLYNATRGGKLEELVRVDFDELMNKH